MDKSQVIRELTAEDVKLLPDSVRQAIVAGVPEVTLLQELRQALGADDKADLKAIVTEMRQTQAKAAQDAIKLRIRELVEDTEKGVKIVALRGLVTEMIALRKPATVAEVDTVYAEVVASPAVTAALAGRVQEVMGPRQGSPIGDNGKTGDKPKYYTIPEQDAA